jgi:hypothetical protein
MEFNKLWNVIRGPERRGLCRMAQAQEPHRGDEINAEEER